MTVDIGKKISEYFGRMDISDKKKFCLEKLNMTKQNFYRILKKKSIHTDLVERFSKAFEYDLFNFFYEEEPLKSLSNRQIEKLQLRNMELTDVIDRKEALIKDLERKIKYLKEEMEKYEKRIVGSGREQ